MAETTESYIERQIFENETMKHLISGKLDENEITTL